MRHPAREPAPRSKPAPSRGLSSVENGLDYLAAWRAAAPLIEADPGDPGERDILASSTPKPDPRILDEIDRFDSKHPTHPLVRLSRDRHHDALDLALLHTLALDRVLNSDDTVGLTVLAVMQAAGVRRPECAVRESWRLRPGAPLVAAGLVEVRDGPKTRWLGRACAATDTLMRCALGDGEPLEVVKGEDAPEGLPPFLRAPEEAPLVTAPTNGPLFLPSAAEGRFQRLIRVVRGREHSLAAGGMNALLPAGKGVSALFWGESGCGKTQAARHLAAELGRPLIEQTCASLIDKYFGESERNVTRAFEEAAKAGAVLLFDEADSLVTNRTDASHTLYRQVTTTFLTALERFDGVAVFTTNFADALDGALARRLSMQIEFTRPPADVRLRIWEGLLPEGTKLDEDVDLDHLAEWDLTGGEIKNVILAVLDDAYARGLDSLSLADFEIAVETLVSGCGLRRVEEESLGFRSARGGLAQGAQAGRRTTCSTT